MIVYILERKTLAGAKRIPFWSSWQWVSKVT